MPPRRYVLSHRAERDMRRVPIEVRIRVFAALDRYIDEAAGTARKLHGVADEWRIRVGDWRVRFELVEGGHTMLILRVLPRGRAYRD